MESHFCLAIGDLSTYFDKFLKNEIRTQTINTPLPMSQKARPNRRVFYEKEKQKKQQTLPNPPAHKKKTNPPAFGHPLSQGG
jgi:hypothetical protein